MKYRVPALGRFDRYVLLDHKARWRNDAFCMSAAWVWYVARSLYGSASDTRLLEETAAILAVGMVGTTIRYCTTSEKLKSFAVGFGITRRALVGQGLAALFASFVVFAQPVGAVLIDEQLKRTLKAPLTSAKLDKAALLVMNAQKFDVRLNPDTVRTLGNEVLTATAEQPHLATSAISASATFAGYSTYLLAPRFVRGRVIHLERDGLVADLILVGPEVAKDFAIWIAGPGVYGGGKGPPSIVPPVQHVIVQVRQETYSFWVNSHLRNITFVNANIGYFGGSIKLEAVQFIDCHFQVLTHDAESRENVKRFLSAVLTGEPVNLDLLGQGVVLP
jgi:hypothetical protein